MLSENSFTGTWNFDAKLMEGLSVLYLSQNPDLEGTVSVEQLSRWSHLEALDINQTSIEILAFNNGTDDGVPVSLEHLFRCTYWQYHHEQLPCRVYQGQPNGN